MGQDGIAKISLESLTACLYHLNLLAAYSSKLEAFFITCSIFSAQLLDSGLGKGKLCPSTLSETI
ncbi:hypothetical protein QWZ13_01230 [Reinekea marina]|uniref:hypothetical protein n=1 Tax=Reinekea marina TaxID=1310421 RepID=UPI0025B46403|nr:hypothetical protein [Reinekea marina]MDN3647525.1 hypothetical protein [Reinekea marina]